VTNALECPELTAFVIPLNWHGERLAFRAYPPLCSIKWTLTFKRLAAPAPKLRLPISSTEEAIGDHGTLVTGCDVFSWTGHEALWSNDAVALQNFPDIVKGLNIDIGI
jgi:hypothetical protein